MNTIGAAERIDERAREWEDGRRPVGENASEEANKRTRSHTVTPILLVSIISVFSTFSSSLFLNQGHGKRWESDKCSDPFRGACPRRDLGVSPGGVCLVAGSAGHRGPVRKQHCRVRSHLVTKRFFDQPKIRDFGRGRRLEMKISSSLSVFRGKEVNAFSWRGAHPTNLTTSLPDFLTNETPSPLLHLAFLLPPSIPSP